MSQINKVKLGYWKGYGFVQQVRYLLELTETPYEEVLYVEDSDWFVRDKFSFGLTFPNLPFLINGDVKLTEVSAIFDYVADTYGKAEWRGVGADVYTVKTLQSLSKDLVSAVYHYGLKSAEEKEKFLQESLIAKLKFIYEFLGEKQFLLGNFTYADLFFLSVIKYFHATIPVEHIAQFADRFNPWLARVTAIPQIAAYIASDRHPQ